MSLVVELRHLLVVRVEVNSTGSRCGLEMPNDSFLGPVPNQIPVPPRVTHVPWD
jgi:hypothetical protein